LRSGEEGSVHIEQVLEYNEDPKYLADLLTYKLSIEAQKRVEKSELSRRQLAKQLNTSVPQLYRLLDPANTSKSMKQLVTLLHVLDCSVDLVVKKQQPNNRLQRTRPNVTHFAKSKMRAISARR
jgi:predicted XRE-type DNA-binding protein